MGHPPFRFSPLSHFDEWKDLISDKYIAFIQWHLFLYDFIIRLPNNFPKTNGIWRILTSVFFQKYNDAMNLARINTVTLQLSFPYLQVQYLCLPFFAQTHAHLSLLFFLCSYFLLPCIKAIFFQPTGIPMEGKKYIFFCVHLHHWCAYYVRSRSHISKILSRVRDPSLISTLDPSLRSIWILSWSNCPERTIHPNNRSMRWLRHSFSANQRRDADRLWRHDPVTCFRRQSWRHSIAMWVPGVNLE